MANDTARTVEKVEIKKAFKFGGEQITFTPEEVNSLRHFGDPGIRIIGFKPMSMLPIWANLKPSTFIYPSEDDYVGSTRVFAALQKKLLDDRKVGIAWYVARKNAVPQIAAIIPGAEKLDDLGAQVIPPGLWIAPLPFADDIRQNPETTLIRAPEPLIDLMREVIQQLQLPKAIYDPSRYPNPCKFAPDPVSSDMVSLETGKLTVTRQRFNGTIASSKPWPWKRKSPNNQTIRQFPSTAKSIKYVAPNPTLPPHLYPSITKLNPWIASRLVRHQLGL